METICAIATAPGVGGIAVIRISGAQAWKIAAQLTGGKLAGESVEPNTVRVAPIYKDGEFLDEVVLTFFRGPRSYTGEDVVEISCHGGDFAAKQLISLLLSHGLRMARPGEFTERAFLNGKLDLAQAEAVAGLIHARSEQSGRSAARQLAGALSEVIVEMRSKVLDLLALLELELDFSEEDVSFQSQESRSATLDELRDRLGGLIKSYDRGRLAREGLRVAIVGAPNAGKSTLLNRIVGDDRAIVSDEPGTTRDVIEAHLELGGLEVIFQDTAGLRETTHAIESAGIARAKQTISRSDLVLLLIDSTQPTLPDTDTLKLLADKSLFEVLSKRDLPHDGALSIASPYLPEILELHRVSAVTGAGVEELLESIAAWSAEDRTAAQDIIVTEARHHDALVRAAESLARAQEQLREPTLMASDLRDAANALGEITGETIGEEILDRIFSQFCIGK